MKQFTFSIRTTSVFRQIASIGLIVAFLTSGIFAISMQAFGDSSDDRPNIVFIMADDMGFGDASPLNPDSTIPTPNFERLASEGMTFTDAHTPSAVCTPTRYGIVTGRYCWRSRLKSGVLNGYSPHLIEDGRQTVAAMLQDAGYKTAVIGKWHLGLDFATLPPEGDHRWKFDYSKPLTHGPHVLGFDYFYGIPASLDFPPYVYIENDQVLELPTVDQPSQSFPAYLRAGERQPGLVMENCLDDLTAKACEYIDDNKSADQPFFLYFPLTAPHKPVLPHPRFRGKSGVGPYGDFVMQVDWTVGQVLNALDEAGIADETLLFYTSDNGSFMHRIDGEPDHFDVSVGSEPSPTKGPINDHLQDETLQSYNSDTHTANGVFRGTKADIWEGGHHVPFFVRWPGRVDAGSACAQTICLVDLFATCADIAGGETGPDAAEDSFSLLPLLDGDTDNGRAPVIHHSAAGMFAIRDGKWKMVAGTGSGGRQDPRGKKFEQPYMLFDMEQDIREQHDVAAENPQVVEALTEKLEEIMR